MGTRTSQGFVGYWRITEMEMWDAEYLDLVVPAFIEFDREQMGAFQFGTVRGWLDCRFSERDRVPVVEFSWKGENDDDSGCGRGWAPFGGIVLKGGSTSTEATTRRSSRREPLGEGLRRLQRCDGQLVL